MRIIDRSGLRLVCDSCQVAIDVVVDPTATVGFHGDLNVFHSWCAPKAYQFLVADQARTMTVVEMCRELLLAVGLTQADVYPS